MSEQGDGVKQTGSIQASSNYGFSTLPKDALIRIIEFVFAESEDIKWDNVDDEVEADAYSDYRFKRLEIMQLSLVSRSFRTAVVNTVSLWTKITPKDVFCHGFEDCILRSKREPLTVKLNLDDKWRKALSLTLPSKDRWRLTCFTFSANAKDVAKAYPSVEFPNVESLIICFVNDKNYSRLFAQWTFPKVSTLHFYNSVPPKGYFRDVTTLNLTVRRAVEKGQRPTDIYVRKMLAFLGEMNRLQTLSIDLSGIVDPLDDEPESDDIELPSITNFSLTNFNPKINELYHIGAICIGFIIEGINIPNVKDCKLRLRFQVKDELRDFTDMFFTSRFGMSSGFFEEVTSLSVVVLFPVDGLFVLRFLRMFPNLETLELENTHFASFLRKTPNHLGLERLRRFVLRENWPIKWDWKADLHKLTSNVHNLDASFAGPSYYNILSDLEGDDVDVEDGDD